MSRGEKRVLFTVLALLAAALAILLGQGLTGGAPPIYRVSVLTDGSDESYWSGFRKGLEQAARDQSVDVRYVTRYDGADSQADALRREWEGEADGVVVIPADGDALAGALAQAPQQLVVTLSGARPDTGHAAAFVSADNQAMGARLADAVSGDGWATCAVLLTPGSGAAAGERYAGFLQRAEVLGLSCANLETGDAAGAEADRALVAMEPAGAEALCQQGGAAGRVYGLGSSNRLLRALEDGLVAALVVQSDYAAGYLSLQRTVEALQGNFPGDVTLDCYTVTRENMFTEPLVQILFPVG